MHENSVPSRFFDPRCDLLKKIWGSICHLQKLCKLFPQALIYLKSAMLNMQANAAVSEQQNCSNSMLKLAGDLKLDRWIAFDPLYTLSLTLFLYLYKWKFSNTQHHFVVKREISVYLRYRPNRAILREGEVAARQKRRRMTRRDTERRTVWVHNRHRSAYSKHTQKSSNADMA